MQIKPVIGSVVGKTNDEHWGQVLTLPQAYGVVEIDDEHGTARDHGVDRLGKLSNLLEKFPTSLDEVKSVADGVMGDSLVTLLLLVPVGRIIYLALRGDGAVYLKRDSQLACLLRSEGGLSGEVRSGDTLLLLSRSFTSALTESELSGVFDHLSATEAAEKLTLLLHEASGGTGGAGLVFQVGGMIPVEDEVSDRAAVVAQPVYEKVAGASGIARFHHARGRFFSMLRGKNKFALLISFTLITVFLLSIIVGIGRQLSSGGNAQAEKTLVEATRIYEEGVALLDLNSLKGRERLTAAKDMLTPLASTSSNTSLGRRIKSLAKQISDSLSLASQVTRGEPQLFYDAGLLKSSAAISAVAYDNDILVILDKTTRNVFSLDVSSKKGTIVAGGGAFAGSKFIGIHGDFVYVLADSGINSISLNDNTVVSAVIKPDKEWGAVADLTAFGGNLYLLDTAKSRIWKYIATDNGFSTMKEYLNPDTLPDLSRATGMAIDGSVWLGTTDGKIYKFTQGKGDTYVPRGLDSAFGNNLKVYTSDSDNNLYVLDPDNKRVVVLGKDGIYVAQYVWAGNFRPSQIVVSEKLKKIFLLIDGKIYVLNLS